MAMNRPEKPQGRHVRLLREFLGLSQTKFGALLDINQPDVSTWEAPHKRDVFLPPDLAERFLEVWDCFPTPPTGGFNDIMAALVAYRDRKSPVPASQDLIPMVPARPASTEAPEIYWKQPGGAPPPDRRETAAPPAAISKSRGEDAPASARTEADPIDHAQRTDIFRAQVSILTTSILFAVWRHAWAPGNTAPRQRARLGRWMATVTLIALLLPTGCFQAYRDAMRGEADGSLWLFLGLFFQGPHQLGDRPPAERYVPKTPLPGQKRAPCDPEAGEATLNDGCWFGSSDVKPPCGRKLFRSGDKCYRPVAADPKVPVGQLEMRSQIAHDENSGK